MPDGPKTPAPDCSASPAKRIAGWAVKGVLTALVLVAGVVFGREVLILWRGGDVPEQCSTAASQIDPRQPHTVTFGEAAWSMRRREIVGNMSSAVTKLRTESVALLQNVQPRPLVAQNTGATDGRGFIELIADLSPVASEADKWRLYEFNEAFPTVVGVAQHGYQVIMWGIAIPTGADRWSLCIFLPNDLSAEKESAAFDVSLPPDAKRTLAVRTVTGEAIVSFSGRGEADRWQRFFDEWFAKQGWKAGVPWRQSGNVAQPPSAVDVWYAEYVSSDYGGRKVEVHFGRDDRGGLSGLLMIAPPTPR